MVIESMLVHPFPSVKVTVYEPAAKFVGLATVAPFDQRKAYGVAPPEPKAEAAPSFPPKQDTCCARLMETPSAEGWVIEALEVATHPLSSVKVIV